MRFAEQDSLLLPWRLRDFGNHNLLRILIIAG
uniref:Uncharacterized protein n=1 Tax=Lotus japonicus TaxID=34305 RepID=I3SRN8_LOTJA|nr:unknown [Lotus japonicus]